MRFFKDKGFTTIELMTVIVIVAILLVIAVPNFLNMSNRSAVTATTNELVGLIQFTKNTAKVANKPTVLKPCASTENCDMFVSYAEDAASTDKSLRIITFPKKINFGTGDLSATDKEKSIAFYADGTRGIHATNLKVKEFNADGAVATTDTNLGAYAAGEVAWQVSTGEKGSGGYYCRKITISLVGNVAVKEECE